MSARSRYRRERLRRQRENPKPAAPVTMADDAQLRAHLDHAMKHVAMFGGWLWGTTQDPTIRKSVAELFQNIGLQRTPEEIAAHMAGVQAPSPSPLLKVVGGQVQKA